MVNDYADFIEKTKQGGGGGRRDIPSFGLETVRDIYFKIEA
jgi:hypothetical protein